MASGGWRRGPVVRSDQSQFAKDELLQSLSSQYNVDFAVYDRWKREVKVPRAKACRNTTGGVADQTFRVGPRPQTAPPVRFLVRERRRTAKELEEEAQRAERIRMLEMRIFTVKKTLQEYENRFRELLAMNLALKELIEQRESGTHDAVKLLLRKYERFRGGIDTLRSNFIKEVAEAKKSYHNAQVRLQKVITELEQQATDLDCQLEQSQEQLDILNNYKDKEYPVKVLHVANMRKQIENLTLAYQEETKDTRHIMVTELLKYEKESTRRNAVVNRLVMEKTLKMVHPTLIDMAHQNVKMEREIHFHKQEQAELQAGNQQLEAEVRALLQDPKTNIRLQMFPEFFPPQQKCTPNMDVILDIPTHRWLPI